MDLLHYSIVEKIGEGGMATVYLAEHQLLGQKFAIKILHDEFVRNKNIRNRFIAEAKNMARMSHQNIIKVTDLIDAGDLVAFVMEYIEGQTLKEYLDTNGKLSANEIKKLFVQMLDAIGYVHEQGLVHRDIKPSNFMISPNGVLKLLDFGIAKNTDVNSSEYTMTGTTQNMGTPMYMSPEQIKSTREVTYQSDIYSLGVVLWQMVAGRKPYNSKELSIPEIQVSILKDNLPLTKTKWDVIIKKAMQKSVKLRYSQCSKMGDDILATNLQSTNNKREKKSDDSTLVENINSEKNKKAIASSSNFRKKQKKHGIEIVAPIVEKKKTSPVLYLLIVILGVSLGWVRNYNSASDTNVLDTPVKMEWADIPAGTFTMGSPTTEVGRSEDEIQHEVTLSPFKMSKYEVTFDQYDAFCDATGRVKPNDEGWGRGKRPVINVSWNDANAFATWMGCRLPTEAEWEYACRAGSTSPFNTGINLTTSQANFNGNDPYSNFEQGENLQKTLPVGRFEPNSWGLYDMHGNVSEFCIDWYGKNSTKSQTDPVGPLEGFYRVNRGGNWELGGNSCRSAYRFVASQEYIFNTTGFRLVF